MRTSTFLRTVIVACSTFNFLPADGQQLRLDLGDKAFDRLDYAEAAHHYEIAAAHGAMDKVIAKKLALSYQHLKETTKALEWYGKAAAAPNAGAMDFYNYGQVLRSSGRAAEADVWEARYRSATGNSGPGDATMSFVLNGEEAQVRPLAINSPYADMGVALSGELAVLSSARHIGGEGRARAQANEAFLDLFAAHVDASGELSAIRPLSTVNTGLHESNATFSPDGRTMWFTRNVQRGERKAANGADLMDLKIYSRTRAGEEWSDERPFEHNDPAWSSSHPCISPDGTTLFFVSDKPGGAGATDIWYCTRNSSGGWGDPVCMGPRVNTAGRELFPFIDAQGHLFFSSDGRNGLGGLDIFVCRVSDEGLVSKARNLGAPVNSASDDLAFVMRDDRTHGYITSDRPGGVGGDDLYAVVLQHPIATGPVISGQMEGDAGKPTRKLFLQLLDHDGDTLQEMGLGDDGSFAFPVQPGRDYTVVATGEGFRRMEMRFTTTAEMDSLYSTKFVPLAEYEVPILMHVINANTREPIEGVRVRWMPHAGEGDEQHSATNQAGDLREVLKHTVTGDVIDLDITMEREGYFPKRGRLRYCAKGPGEELAVHHILDLSMVPTDELPMIVHEMVPMELIDLALSLGMDLGRAMSIEPILFDRGKAEIRGDASVQMEKIAALMRARPTVRILLGSHTDSHGDDRRNQALSRRRAEATKSYLVESGIKAERISCKGFGEGKLLNKCKDGVDCSEDEHRINRRTEFVVVAQ